MKLTKERLTQIINEEMRFYETEEQAGLGGATPSAVTPQDKESSALSAAGQKHGVESGEEDPEAVLKVMQLVGTKIKTANQYTSLITNLMKYDANGGISTGSKGTALKQLYKILGDFIKIR